MIDACKKLNRNSIMLAFPVLFDGLALLAGLYFVGFYGKGMTSIRMILEMGMPSIGHLSNIQLPMNDMRFLSIPVEELPFITLLITITFVLMGAFLQGSYIGCLAAVAKNELVSVKFLIRVGLKNWIQFILLEIILFFGKIGLAAFLALFFGIIGVFASLVVFMTIRIVFIYLEFTMVVDGVGITKAFKKSRGYLMQSLLTSLPLIILMYTVSSVFSLALHYFWSPVMVMAMTAIYAYIMTVIQLLFMTVFVATREERAVSVKMLFA